MNCCKSSQCVGIEEVFDTSMAESDLKRYLKQGPSRPTRRLLDAIRQYDLEDVTLMDVGGGIGIIQHELVNNAVGRIINVDASPAYAQFARQEAESRGYADRASYHVGDFVDISPTLDTADVVTLDRVICCYDDMQSLVRASLDKSKRLLGVIYPIDRWFFVLGTRLVNAIQSLLNRNYNMFAHSNAAVEDMIESAGFRRTYYHRGFLWQVALYEKQN